MAEFTPITKQRLNWQAKTNNHTPTGAVFATETKEKLNWQAPSNSTIRGNKYLNIGSGFNLLISNSYKLVIQPGNETQWTEVVKTR